MFDSIDGMTISLEPDENGMIGRECPVDSCSGYFKIRFGTGIREEGYQKCYCPYCGNEGTQNQYFTQDQIQYIQSIAIRKLQQSLGSMAKSWDRDLRRKTRNSFIKLSVDYKASARSIAYYAERELETHLTCENCTLEYAVYGKFAYCPDCGVDNTLQILNGNLALADKQLQQAELQDDEKFKIYLIHDALENVVSATDSFGNNLQNLAIKKSGRDSKRISLQNLTKARQSFLTEHGFDLAEGLTEESWKEVVTGFQKRHVITHNDGIVDEQYIQITGDEAAVRGRKVSISSLEIRELAELTKKIAQNLQTGLNNHSRKQEDLENGIQRH